MKSNMTTLERAFELARSGEYSGTSEIRVQLQTEGYPDVSSQVSGPSLLKQLRALCEAARATNSG